MTFDVSDIYDVDTLRVRRDETTCRLLNLKIYHTYLVKNLNKFKLGIVYRERELEEIKAMREEKT